MIFMRSQIMRMARTMPASLAVPIASTLARIAASVRRDSVVRRPSAIVVAAGSASTRPERKLRAASSALAGSAPKTRITGALDLTAIDVPESSPPPPTGAMIASSPGDCSRSSSAAVPCPAMTRTSSNGCTSVAPVSRRTAAHAASRASMVGAQKRIVAPRRRTFSCLTRGAVSGITTNAGIPRRAAAYATAAPWLPDEWVTTP